VIPDNTLGNGNHSVTSTTGNRTDITGGAGRGSALFHSFERFNISPNEQVYFANPASIRNIFSRVTGGSLSNINGLLGVAGSANLFFMNPNGIIFGPNARLDVSGSFLATTANALEFPDNQKFAATGDRAVPLVEVNLPIGLQFGANPPAMLTNRGNLATGQNLTLAAGNLDLQGQLQAGSNLTLNATDTVKIRDTITEPFLARSGGDMTIQGNQGIDILTLNHLSQIPFVSGGNFDLISDGVISGDAHYQTGGSFSILNTKGNTGDFLSIYDPIITAAGDVTFGDYTGASLQVTAGGSINIGAITINAIDLALGDNPVLTLQAGVLGNPNNPAFPFPLGGTNFTTAPATTPAGITVSGNISTTLNQPFTVDLSAPGNIATKDIVAATNNNSGFSVIRLNSTGGSVILDNANLTVSNADSTGVSGDIFIKAAQDIQIADSTIESRGVFGRIFLGVVEASGDTSVGNRLTINKSSLTVTNGLSGTGGSININIPGTSPIPATPTTPAVPAIPGLVTITDSSLRAPSSDTANGGSIGLAVGNAGSISTSSSILDASISGTGGTGGGVNLRAPDGTITLDRNSLITTATTPAPTVPNLPTTTASGSPIDITATNGIVTLSGSSALNATTSTAGTGGNITVRANEVTVNQSSLINTTVLSGGTAKGGDITISADTFSLTDGGRVQANTFADGNAGNIQLSFTNTATIAGFDSESFLYSGMLTETRAEATGIGGNITINPPALNPPASSLVGTLTISDGGFLSARTLSSATGGNIGINVNNLTMERGGQVLTTSSSSGNAGSITVNAAGDVRISNGRPVPTAPVSPFTNPDSTPANFLLSLDNLAFNNANDPNVEASGGFPFISLQRNPTGQSGRIFASQNASGDAVINGTNLGPANDFDYYSFSIRSDGSQAIFDVDNAVSSIPNTFIDTELFLFDALTGQLLARNDDFSPTDTGSTSLRDSRISYNFNLAGRYVLGVGRYSSSPTPPVAATPPLSGTPLVAADPSGTPQVTGDPYRLQVSLQNQGAGTFNLSDRNPNQGLNSGLFAQALSTGAGGSITVQAATLGMSNNAEINASTSSSGNGGSVSINNVGSVTLNNNANISVNTSAPFSGGNGGSISITNAGSVALTNNSSISASTEGDGGIGGSIAISSGLFR
jgi:filamentous hemagglutinin family protein